MWKRWKVEKAIRVEALFSLGLVFVAGSASGVGEIYWKPLLENSSLHVCPLFISSRCQRERDQPAVQGLRLLPFAKFVRRGNTLETLLTRKSGLSHRQPKQMRAPFDSELTVDCIAEPHSTNLRTWTTSVFKSWNSIVHETGEEAKKT